MSKVSPTRKQRKQRIIALEEHFLAESYGAETATETQI
jgi:hypothetical protein